MTDASSSVVDPAYRPTLPELIGRRRAVVALLAVTVPIVLVAIASTVTFRADDVRFLNDDAPVFNLRHSPTLQRLAPEPGGVLKLEARRDGLFLQSFTARAVRLPRYRGTVSGALPIFASRVRDRLARRYDAFVALEEGKTRINGIPGYQVAFRAKLGERTLWGREFVLVPEEPGARDGVALRLLQTPAAGATKAADVGAVGALKKPLRSFRFGTDTTGEA